MTAVATRRLLAGAAAIAVTGGIALFNRWIVRTGPPADALIVASACFAVGALAWVAAEWPRSRARIVIPALLASLVSLATTLWYEPRVAEQDAFWVVTESGALFALAVLIVRWSPARTAWLAGGAVIATTALTFLRVTQPAWSTEFLGAFITWGLGAAAAAAFGLYLRVLDEKRARMIDDARQAQRMEVARDLHDFVAHDVTGMVVQAQAANVVARRDPQQALSALARIEAAGLRALGSLDRTVGMLGNLAQQPENEAETDVAQPTTAATRNVGIDDMLALIGRFAATDARPVRLHADIGAHSLPPQVADVAHRVLSEALTNVRRHAGATASVEVSLVTRTTSAGSDLMVRVANANGAAARPALPAGEVERGGQGLRSLADTVRACGGSFDAQPLAANGAWQLTAVLPLQDTRS